MKPIVAVGIGNTTTKLGIAESANWPPVWRHTVEFETASFEPSQLVETLPDDKIPWYVANVHRAGEARLAAWVGRVRPEDDYHRCRHDRLPLEIAVRAPDRVGLDRLVAAVAVNRLRETNRPAVVVDAGTAITVDLIDAKGIFRGGAILPGPRIAATALAEYTDLLPLADYRFDGDPPSPVGNATEPAIRSGLFYGSIGAIAELIRRMTESTPDAQIFVTGGDSRQMATLIDPAAEYVSDLVLRGVLEVARRHLNDEDLVTND